MTELKLTLDNATVDLSDVQCYDFSCSEKEPDVWECLRLNIEQRNKPGRNIERNSAEKASSVARRRQVWRRHADSYLSQRLKERNEYGFPIFTPQ